MAPLLRPRNDPLLVHLLHRRFHWFHQAMLATLPEVGLEHVTPVQCHLLSRIDRHGTRTAELARRLGVTRQAAHQQVRDLLRRGLIELRPDPTNRSAKLVVHTEAGAEVWRELRYIHLGMEEVLSDRIGEGDVGVLFTVLKEDWGSPLPPYPEPATAHPPRGVPLPPPTLRRGAARRR